MFEVIQSVQSGRPLIFDDYRTWKQAEQAAREYVAGSGNNATVVQVRNDTRQVIRRETIKAK